MTWRCREDNMRFDVLTYRRSVPFVERRQMEDQTSPSEPLLSALEAQNGFVSSNGVCTDDPHADVVSICKSIEESSALISKYK